MISSRISFDQLPDYYRKISANPDGYMKVVALL